MRERNATAVGAWRAPGASRRAAAGRGRRRRTCRRAKALPLDPIVGAQLPAQAGDRVDDPVVVTREAGRPARHQGVDVLELLERGPALVALAPVHTGRQPDSEGLGEVLVGVALRVPGLEVDHEAAAVGLGAYESGYGSEVFPKIWLPLASAPQPVGVLGGGRGQTDSAQDAQAPVGSCRSTSSICERSSPGQARVREVEGEGDAGTPSGVKNSSDSQKWGRNADPRAPSSAFSSPIIGSSGLPSMCRSTVAQAQLRGGARRSSRPTPKAAAGARRGRRRGSVIGSVLTPGDYHRIRPRVPDHRTSPVRPPRHTPAERVDESGRCGRSICIS